MWLRPAMFGAIIVGGIVSIRVLFVLPMLFTHPGVVAEALGVVGIAAGAGAAGGLVYSLVGRPLQGIPRIGPYLTGVTTVAGYLGALGLVLPSLDPDASGMFTSSSGRFSYVVCVLIFGIIMGRSWFSGPDAIGIEPPPQQP